jgi:hypothetical protein
LANWQNSKLTNWLIGKTIKSNVHQIDEMASRQNSKLTKWQLDKIQLTKWQIYEMAC